MKDLEKQFHEFVSMHTDHASYLNCKVDLHQEHYNLQMDLAVAESSIKWMINALELLDDNDLIFREKSEFEKLEVDIKKVKERIKIQEHIKPKPLEV